MESTHSSRCLGLVVLLLLSAQVVAAEKAKTHSGVVTSISGGSLYLDGIPHMIATVQVSGGKDEERVAFSTLGVMQGLQVGESISYAGPVIWVNLEPVVNTKAGFFFRPNEKSMSAFMAEMQANAQKQAQELSKAGIPNAVPTVLMQTSEQAEESASERRTDLILTIMSIVLALLAFDRLRSLVVGLYRWVRDRFAKKSIQPEHGSHSA